MADTPFGLSFGNPRQYMGSSGLKEMADDYKKFATAQIVEKSGLRDFLNEKLGNPKEGYKPPSDYVASGGVVPPANYGFAAPQGSAMPDATGTGFKGTVQQGIGMPAPVGMSQYQGAQSPYDMAYKAGAAPSISPAASQEQSTGSHLMDAMKAFNVSTFVDPQAQRDIPVDQSGGYTQQLGSGMDYQKVPGYGKLAKTLQAMTGFMG